MSSFQGTIIDSHVHLFNGLADLETLDCLQARSGAAALGIASLPIGCMHYGTHETHLSGFLRKKQRPSETYLFAALDYSVPGAKEGKLDFSKQAVAQLEAGADGIKMLEGKPGPRRDTGLPLDAKAYHSFYDYLQEYRIPLLLHVADPAEFWDPDKASDFAKENGWFWGDGSCLSKEALYAEAEGVLQKFPELKLTFAHFFFLSGEIDRAKALLDRWPNICIDITPGFEMYHDFSREPAKWREFFTSYASRIIFGTDNCGSPEKLEEGVNAYASLRKFLETDEPSFSGRGLALDDKTLSLIYAKNFQNRVGETPSPLKMDKVLALCDAALNSLRKEPEKQTRIEKIRKLLQS
ncbi:MAG: hypothetical protein A2X49_14715 [Lentisphaerae bacterium GWF2_52_8]|nr:MAG: hypothetical protein A2X49_14715 [Lentisphaerae bacterium GWF2_52_8]